MHIHTLCLSYNDDIIKEKEENVNFYEKLLEKNSKMTVNEDDFIRGILDDFIPQTDKTTDDSTIESEAEEEHTLKRTSSQKTEDTPNKKVRNSESIEDELEADMEQSWIVHQM